jgi:hypothetical protein
MRIGVSLGGISTFSVVAEWFSDTHAVEVAVGTWAFRDVSVSAVYKEYFFASRVRPFVGAGLWTVAAFPPDGRAGVALVLRLPVGAEWTFVDDHSVGAAINGNRALWVRAADPEDDVPPVGRIVPLPELYYRLTL